MCSKQYRELHGNIRIVCIRFFFAVVFEYGFNLTATEVDSLVDVLHQFVEILVIPIGNDLEVIVK